MTPQELEAALVRTLEDRHISGSEKRALTELLADASLSNHQRNALRNRAFALARDAASEPRARETIGWLEEINKLLLPKMEQADAAPIEALFNPGPACAQRIIGLLGNTRRGADLCVFTIADDRISEAILAAHRRGVALRILSDDQKSQDAGSDIERFQRAGIPVRLDAGPDHMHHKFAVFDQSTVVTGSFNWTRSASEFNQENIIVCSEPKLVKAFSAEFEKLWQAM